MSTKELIPRILGLELGWEDATLNETDTILQPTLEEGALSFRGGRCEFSAGLRSLVEEALRPDSNSFVCIVRLPKGVMWKQGDPWALYGETRHLGGLVDTPANEVFVVPEGSGIVMKVNVTEAAIQRDLSASLEDRLARPSTGPMNFLFVYDQGGFVSTDEVGAVVGGSGS